MNTSITLNLHRVDNKKTKAKSTLVVGLLKKYGIPGTQAVRMYNQNGGEYIVRKCFQLDFFKEKYLMRDGFGIKDERRWLMANINNMYDESDEFINWFENKKDYIIKTDSELKELLSV